MNVANVKGTLFWVPVMILSMLTLFGLIWLEMRPDPTLHEMAAAGDLKPLQKRIKKTSDVDALNNEGWTALTCAVDAGQEDAVKLLLMAGADMDQRSYDGSTALHHAVAMDHPELITALLDAGADPHVKDRNEESSLCLAIQQNGRGIAFLLERGVALDKAGEKKGDGYLFYAARSGCLPVLEQLLADGADVNGCSSVGVTPLLYAAHEGQLDAVRLLIEQGADVNATARLGWTPLHHAVLEEHMDLIGFLLENGAELEARDSGGHTPLLMAAQRGCVDAFRELLEAGADIDVEDDEQRGVEALARAAHQIEILELIRAHRETMRGRTEKPMSAF